MQKTYKDYSKYYDLIYQEKDYQSEIAFILKLIKKHNLSCQSVLDIGCGTGTHLSLIRPHFKELYGIDLNEAILALAKEKMPEAHFSQADMKSFSLNLQFDLVTCLYSVFNFNLDFDSALHTLKNIYHHLKNPGISVISLYSEKSVVKKTTIHLGQSRNAKVAKFNQVKYYAKEKVIKSDHVLLIKENGILDFDIESGDTYRVFDKEELDELAAQAGFSKWKLYDGFSFKPLQKKTTYPVWVLEKRSST